MTIVGRNLKGSNSSGFADQLNEQELSLQEGLDYYLENGLLVFTATFLRKRGYCCENGCRHCPYDYDSERAVE